ncbi:MAG: N-acetylmuramoyl-L-alanine amidase, partial [Elusimicrobia bacterium]|nr:N-acetylmuramoyl-L-alanine amidase [Elusimicrobiota bacterium]
MTLTGPLRRENGTVLIPADFEKKVLGQTLPVAGSFGTSKPGVLLRRVALDPGHGGKDPGAVGFKGLQEKEVVLDIARRVRKGLLASGITVVMTREGDEFISLERRTAIASCEKADLFVSIHANAHKSRRAR